MSKFWTQKTFLIGSSKRFLIDIQFPKETLGQKQNLKNIVESISEQLFISFQGKNVILFFSIPIPYFYFNTVGFFEAFDII